MALTPEQVLNKHFQTTQFRRGYEERDVDDFLDEIVAEMRSLIEQRDDYLKQLNDCRASKNQGAVRADGATAARPRPLSVVRVTTPSWVASRRRSRTPSVPSRPRPTELPRPRQTPTTPSGQPGSASSAPRPMPSGPRPQRVRRGRDRARRGAGEAEPAQHAGRRRGVQALQGPGGGPRRRGARIPRRQRAPRPSQRSVTRPPRAHRPPRSLPRAQRRGRPPSTPQASSRWPSDCTTSTSPPASRGATSSSPRPRLATAR